MNEKLGECINSDKLIPAKWLAQQAPSEKLYGVFILILLSSDVNRVSQVVRAPSVGWKIVSRRNLMLRVSLAKLAPEMFPRIDENWRGWIDVNVLEPDVKSSKHYILLIKKQRTPAVLIKHFPSLENKQQKRKGCGGKTKSLINFFLLQVHIYFVISMN